MDGTPRRWPYSWLPRQAIEKTKSLAATLPGGNSGKTQLPLIPENASAGYCPPSQACCSSKPALCSSEVTTPAQDEVLRFGEFELRPATGELRHLSAAGPAQPQRLPPQPARLLEILVRKQGALATREAPTRIAIVPFELAASEPIRHHDLAKISEWLVAELSSGWQGRLEVIGPRSTAAYDAKPFPDIAGLARDFELDYVLNARDLDDGGSSDLLVELIRVDNGAHPWVQYFETLEPWLATATTVRDGVIEAMHLPP